MSVRVVGIDLSLTSTGVAVADGSDVRVHRITSRGSKSATIAETWRRIDGITEQVLCVFDDRPPSLVVIESPSYGSHTGSQHERGGLWWTVVGQIVAWRCPIATVSPQCRAKYATGRGNAGKDEVLAAVVRRYATVDVTGNDVADAVVLAAMGARYLWQPFDEVPKTHLAAMDGAKW
jgi:crossover junction endodeoxyribonuclease RuvC